MSLSDCPNCKFNGDRGCAVNPDYWMVYEAYGDMSEDHRKAFLVIVPDCKDWESSPDLEPLTLAITLSRREWMGIAAGGSADPHEVKEVRSRFQRQVQSGIGYEPPIEDGFDDIPF